MIWLSLLWEIMCSQLDIMLDLNQSDILKAGEYYLSLQIYNNQNSQFQFASMKRRKIKRKSSSFNLLGSPYNQGRNGDFLNF